MSPNAIPSLLQNMF